MMIDDIEQILADSFTIRVRDQELHNAAVEIDELVRARTLPIYLRLCMLEWHLGQAMVNLASLRQEPIAQQVCLKEFCEVCGKVTEWEFLGHQWREDGTVAFDLHNCVECHASKDLGRNDEDGELD